MRARRGVECGGLLGSGFFRNLDQGPALRRSEVAQHRGELQLGEELAAGFEVRRLRLHRRQIQLQRHMTVYGDKLLG